MADRVECAVAVDTKVETPEGALTVKTLVGKAISVFARDPSGRVRFRRVLNARKLAEQQPVLKITLETGQNFRVGAEQVLYKKGMVECSAANLHVGDELQPAFHFPDGYSYRQDGEADELRSRAAWRVMKIEPAGLADLYALGVNQAGCFFLAAGVLCKAEAAAEKQEV
ncbi:MAG TPA: hypothetical protein VMT89_02915 [Candidatus Acidoferrales bacterium]|nr:hypothetical protein [Candidatus Acidoferrales bacterium]